MLNTNPLTNRFPQFGLGSRTCLGKHISILEMSKLIPRIIREFDFTAEKQTWNTENYWFVKPTDFEVRVRRREKAAGIHDVKESNVSLPYKASVTQTMDTSVDAK